MHIFNEKISSRKISVESSMVGALKHMDTNKVKLLFVFDSNIF